MISVFKNKFRLKSYCIIFLLNLILIWNLKNYGKINIFKDISCCFHYQFDHWWLLLSTDMHVPDALFPLGSADCQISQICQPFLSHVNQVFLYSQQQQQQRNESPCGTSCKLSQELRVVSSPWWLWPAHKCHIRKPFKQHP